MKKERKKENELKREREGKKKGEEIYFESESENQNWNLKIKWIVCISFIERYIFIIQKKIEREGHRQKDKDIFPTLLFFSLTLR